MTVSRVVNGEQNVRPLTRDKVRAAISALNYSPSSTTRRASGSDVVRVGMLYFDPSVGYLNEFLLGMLNKATLRQVQLVVQRCEFREDGQQTLAGMIADGIDGILLPPPFSDSQALLNMVAEADTPAVAVSSGQTHEKVCAIGIDDFQAAYEMTRHLLSLGHRRIGFIVGAEHQACSAKRLEGFRAAMLNAGLDPAQPQMVVQGKFTYRSGLDATEGLLSQPNRPTAIFASNDDMAAAAIAIAHRKGLDVPGDLSVVGFDDSPLATTTWPQLTTVRQPITTMAGTAVDLLVRHIRARREEAPLPCEHVLMEFELIRRQSDATPPACDRPRTDPPDPT